MTRKDYVAIAEAFAQTRPAEYKRPCYTDDGCQWIDDRDAIADVLAADNPRFDRERFYRACEEEK